jgi:GTP-binding protein EngB required for normal cell division
VRGLVRRGTENLTDRLQALAEAVAVADGRLPSGRVENARAVLAHGSERLGLGGHHTIVALAGATGSGKSSLFNAIAEAELSKVGVRRPTTDAVQACVWGRDDAGAVLDWLKVSRRHRVAGEEGFDGLVLLDLPDYDSTELSHRLEVDRIIELVDLFVWVVDPQKYADAAIHERYLRPLAGHSAVTVVVLNQIDLLDDDALTQCKRHLEQLLTSDGLRGVPVLATSVRTGSGLDELRRVLAAKVAERHAAAERLAADVTNVVEDLNGACAGSAARESLGRKQDTALVTALSAAAGAEGVIDAVGRSHIHRAASHTGWFFSRWIRRFKADPLRRLHLGTPEGGAGRTSLPPPSPVQRARVENAVRRVADDATAGLPPPWPDVVRTSALERARALPELLDKEVSAVRLDTRPPTWWRFASALQYLFAVTVAAGGLWLLALFVVAWLRLPEPPTPEIGELPLPTVLFLGGLAAGLLITLVCRPFVRAGAARRRRSARVNLERAIGEVADHHVSGPIVEELRAHNTFCAALARARG